MNGIKNSLSYANGKILHSADKLLAQDSKRTPVSEKYRLWIDRISFFYPTIKTPTPETDYKTLRDYLIDAFNVIDKYGTTYSKLDEQMKNFVAVMMYVIGENKFNSIENFRHNLHKSTRYSDLVAIKYVFDHHRFQDIL